ncbi:short chain dehydrogenase [Streptoalloteichus hindustanus]|uniref:NAD(P)-dependent dehydrogenase, short-chain alcohol dehydrogenase family n=1 Tax=Streptoalloteichus hindustanus TaxID=2017 RepID=A0A1M4YCK5_STRHI|nr:short chain dehydrogenase [Streptoalloteichus hindustanus]SHF03470.1 NAD(P)-dependent dehydrogenase, short-chain alcohol dehydrogenase family [Streptoalloteichus hindustanus]
MKIVVIGASGTIGRAVCAALRARGHAVVAASRSAAVRVDVERPDTVDALFATVSGIDAVVCCAASGGLTTVDAGSDEEFTLGLHGKLLGQVLLLRRAVHHLRDNGSVTLTAGTFETPMRGSAFGVLVNSGLEAFVGAAAREMPRGLRVNVVSPGWVRETLAAVGREGGTPAADVARAYVDAVENSGITGRTLIPTVH